MARSPFVMDEKLSCNQEIEKHQDAERNAIPSKRLEVVFLDKAHQELDGKNRDDKRHCHTGEQNADFAAGHAEAGFHKKFYNF